MPKDILTRFQTDRRHWLRMHQINPDDPSWRIKVTELGQGEQREFHRSFSDRWNDELDNASGACVLRDPDISKIVADSLRHFDGDRYELTDFVVMPNHVHLLVAFPNDEAMLLQCESWKHFTATQINRRLGVKGKFWQQDGFDHLVRSLEQFDHFRSYIRDNPTKGRCREGEFLHYSQSSK